MKIKFLTVDIFIWDSILLIQTDSPLYYNVVVPPFSYMLHANGQFSLSISNCDQPINYSVTYDCTISCQ